MLCQGQIFHWGCFLYIPGIHGSRYITSHGVSLNCNTDLSWFKHIVPCGLKGKEVTSLSKELDKDISMNNTIPFFLDAFQQRFDCDIEDSFLQHQDWDILPTAENLEKLEILHDMNTESNEEIQKVAGANAKWLQRLTLVVKETMKKIGLRWCHTWCWCCHNDFKLSGTFCCCSILIVHYLLVNRVVQMCRGK